MSPEPSEDVYGDASRRARRPRHGVTTASFASGMTTTYHAAYFTEHPQRDTVWAISAHLASPYRPRAGQMLVVATRR